MNVEEIEIIIDEKGQVQIHVQGVKGTACLDLTREIEETLGGEVIEREMTYEASEDENLIDQTNHISDIL